MAGKVALSSLSPSTYSLPRTRSHTWPCVCASASVRRGQTSSLTYTRSHLELIQRARDSQSNQICDKGEEPVQINITYSKKLQDNIEIRKQPDRQSRRGECKGKRLGPKTAKHPSPGTELNSNPKISSVEKAPGGLE